MRPRNKSEFKMKNESNPHESRHFGMIDKYNRQKSTAMARINKMASSGARVGSEKLCVLIGHKWGEFMKISRKGAYNWQIITGNSVFITSRA